MSAVIRSAEMVRAYRVWLKATGGSENGSAMRFMMFVGYKVPHDGEVGYTLDDDKAQLVHQMAGPHGYAIVKAALARK